MPLTSTSKERRRDYARFLLIFVFLGFLMKISSEFIHEMGHAVTVIMLGGKILGISIRAEWPFTLSYTRWNIPNPSNANLALIAVAGILFETVTTIIGQFALFLRKKMSLFYKISIFWLSFWTYLSPVVYLVVGAFYPFGDILDLVNAISIPNYLIFTLGFAMLILCTYSLSIILRDIFSKIFTLTTASSAVSYFWALINTFFVFVTIITYGLPTPPVITVTIIVVIFLWSYLSVRWLLEYISRSRVESTLSSTKHIKRYPMNSTHIEGADRRLKLGYTALFSIALISTIMSGYVVNQYVSSYRIVMKTNIEIEVVDIDLDPNSPTLNLSVSIFNPSNKNMTLDKIEFEVKLNSKFMHRQVFQSIPTASPGSYITFNRVVSLPKDRMFTIEEAVKLDSWKWTLSGAGHVITMFGETLLRFTSENSCKPEIL